MPELPEVETVKRGLDPLLRGRSIDDADIIDGRLTAPEDPVVVSAELIGERFTGVGRRGKYLLFGLDSGRTLVVHLRMTGWFHHRTGAGEEPTHVRAVLRLDDGASLVYADQRRFGTWRLIAPGEPRGRTCGRGRGRSRSRTSGRRAGSAATWPAGGRR